MRCLVPVVLLSACHTFPLVVVRAARDFRCPEDQIQIRGLGDGGYRPRGCGHTEVYECGPAEDCPRTICVQQ